jgi:Flp pilus assembly protein TadD
MAEQRHGAASAALERAASYASGFNEIHYHLAVAYWRNGQRDAADRQLATLSSINQHDPRVALLTRKLNPVAPPPVAY